MDDAGRCRDGVQAASNTPESLCPQHQAIDTLSALFVPLSELLSNGFYYAYAAQGHDMSGLADSTFLTIQEPRRTNIWESLKARPSYSDQYT
ncbi:hypothetical protein IAQ61_009941 [Plenodomus lingam]|uniref:Predicted protein n=1 Tax=Leptosphaeria maculans (strain JN3 / isolate v23.1.3 / race Av1-4-5-6-7-8) TaxID=985895 RepID=E4ZSH1_LEPMJ|nr:predicted protein [Plenodomus lingam JN3]KAH9862524.1 hypothetical protein IAQ61_009941 [Plenodomus lingam]CBX94351.1 predicted protein [Plenodomus lingam JN3]